MQKLTFSTYQTLSKFFCYKTMALIAPQNVFFWTSKQLFAIHFLLATCTVCPLTIPEFFAQTRVSYYWQIIHCCLFERLIRVKRNGVFLFGISIFVLEIFTFLYSANEESDNVVGGSTKTAQHSIENNSRNIKAVFFKLGTSDASQKKQNDTYYVVAMATLLAPVCFCEYPNIPIFKLLKWTRGSCSEYTWFPYCLNSPH